MAQANIYLLLVSFCVCYVTVLGVLPPYHPAQNVNHNEPRNLLIKSYFDLGLTYAEIVAFLMIHHGVSVSVRHLKRIMRSMGLQRRKQQSELDVVVSAIESELKGISNRLGYRSMHQRLERIHGLTVDRETVRHSLKILDPNGVEIRAKKKLIRRKYRSPGPNYIWHIDGYDKLKPFGFCVHGAVDGYSRKILWLSVGSSNNDPKVVTKYFIDSVRQVGGIPHVIRGDSGTENGDVAGIQRFLRWRDSDELAGEKSFLYGKSVSNQRIEAWWSLLRKTNSDWWINFFKDLRDGGVFCDADPIHTNCLKFCFMDIIQKELNDVAINWNLHKIRFQNAESPSGRPDVLYFLPEIEDTHDFKVEVSEDDLDMVEESFCKQVPKCNEEFQEMADILMRAHGLHMPYNADEALTHYYKLIQEIDHI